MRNNSFTYILALSTLLFSCSDTNTDDMTPQEQRQHHKDSLHHRDDHGNNRANEYMNQSEFDALVERFESPERDAWQQPDAVIARLGDVKDKTIADIGSGTGYFAFKLADKGANVIAIDVDERFKKYIEDRIQEDNFDNMYTRLAEYDDPKLDEEETDIILTVNTYHHLDDKIKYLQKCLKGLKSGGKIVIVDFKKKDTPHGPPADHRVSSKAIINDLKAAGFVDVQDDATTLKEQNIIIGVKE